MVAPTPFFADRGCHVRILGEACALGHLGHELRLATYPLGRDVDGVQTHRTIPVPWYRKLSAGPSYHKYYIDVLLALSTARLIRTFRPHVLHAHLHEGAAVARLAAWLSGSPSIPVLLDYQGSLTDEVVSHGFTGRRGVQYRLLKRVEQHVHSTSSHIITSTSRSRDALVNSWGCPESKVTTVADGADTKMFRPVTDAARMSIRARFGLPAAAPIAVYVGVLSEYQGINLLLKAVAELKERWCRPHYLLVGYPDVDIYRALAADLGLADDVTFTGRVAYEETAALTAAADLALAPKISASEGNLKIFNYMACGLPVVCFDNPVNREVLGDVGCYAEEVAAESLARAIARLVASPELRRERGQAGRARVVERFSWSAAAEKIDRIYRRHAAATTAA